MKFQLMLASQQPPATINFPIYASPKLDGIRATIKNGLVISREIKAIPNKNIQKWLGKEYLDGLDGELIITDWTRGSAYVDTASIVMSHEAPIDDILFCVFDRWSFKRRPFKDRLRNVELFIELTQGLKRIRRVPHELVRNQAELDAYEDSILSQGFEGVMLRSPLGEYKHGRSTEREGGMMKLKRFTDSEATILEVLPVVSEGAELPMAGSLTVDDPQFSRPFGVSLSRLSHTEKSSFWANREGHIGRKIKYRYFAYGMVDVPRHGRFTSFFLG